jgi:hypothetical protein
MLELSYFCSEPFSQEHWPPASRCCPRCSDRKPKPGARAPRAISERSHLPQSHEDWSMQRSESSDFTEVSFAICHKSASRTREPTKAQKNTQSLSSLKALYSRDSRFTGAHVDPPRQVWALAKSSPVLVRRNGEVYMEHGSRATCHRGPAGTLEARPILPGTEGASADLLGSYRVPVFRVNSYPYGTEVGVASTVLRVACFPATQPAMVFSTATNAT